MKLQRRHHPKRRTDHQPNPRAHKHHHQRHPHRSIHLPLLLWRGEQGRGGRSHLELLLWIFSGCWMLEFFASHGLIPTDSPPAVAVADSPSPPEQLNSNALPPDFASHVPPCSWRLQSSVALNLSSDPPNPHCATHRSPPPAIPPMPSPSPPLDSSLTAPAACNCTSPTT